MRLIREDLEKVDLEPLRSFVANPDEFFGPMQHYRLLTYLAKRRAGRTAFDIGTHQGDSALALALGGVHVETFDLVDKIGSRSLGGGVQRHSDDLCDPIMREHWRSALLESALILIDIDPHEGTREYELVSWLQANDYRGLIVLDDIWYFEGTRINLWQRIDPRHKTDVTVLGHWSGTGIVSFRELVEIDNRTSKEETPPMNPILPLPVRSENADAVGYVCTRPEEGRAQLEILINLGCKPHHRVLEIGCGALVAGFQIMQYLDAGNYTGIEPNMWLVTSSFRIPEVGAVIESKRPLFGSRTDFRVESENKFDFIISHSILSHTSDAQLTDFLTATKEQLTEGGVLAASIRLAEGNEFGSPGSMLHGPDFTEWQYPGVSWFTCEDVLDRARVAGFPKARVAPELTRTILNGNPKAIHDWICTSDSPAIENTKTDTGVVFVTAFFRLEDRTVDEDEQFRQFESLADSGLPFILFLDEKLADRAPKRSNVKVILKDRLLLSSFLMFPKDVRLPDTRDKSKDTRGFLLLQNSKIEFLGMAAYGEHSCEAAHFAWIDFGIMKIVRDRKSFLENLRQLRPPAECVLAPGCWDRREHDLSHDTVNWRFCGGFLLADKDSIAQLLLVNREELRALSGKSELTWEVNVWAELEKKGQRFDWYKADHDDSIIAIPETVRAAPSPFNRDVRAIGRLLDDKVFGLPRICLNMIVKNEARVIERCLESALPYIDTWCISDTGSRDNTPKIIERFFERHGVPGNMIFFDFENYAQARNNSLNFARAIGGWDYALLIDADMRVEGVLDKSLLSAPAYKILQRNGSIDYFNTRLVRRDSGASYIGVTHEYISVEGVEELAGFAIDDRDDGGNKPEKGERDIRLLTEGLITEPENGRYMFYLAQTYRGMGRAEESIKWYRRRIAAGGWDEEVWYSHYALAHAYKELNNEAEFIKACLEAYNFRPSRGEPLKLLAQLYRETGKNDASALVAKALLEVEYPSDELFVERDVYSFGALQELAIAGFYSKAPKTRAAAHDACVTLTIHPNGFAREEARRNFTYYAKSASDLFGAEVRNIDWRPDDGWAPMNPSICAIGIGRLFVLVRTVNYKVAEGQYPTIDNSGIIRTRNYIIESNMGGWIKAATLIEDDSKIEKTNFPVEGYEDCRLWPAASGGFAISATVRNLQGNDDGRCEMAVISLDEKERVGGVHPIRDYEHHLTQKNWMPIVGLPGHFLYLCDPTIVIDTASPAGRTVEIARHKPPACLVDLRGGSQLIPHGDGWLCVTHEVAWRPERVYLHRFVRFGPAFNVVAVSEPFYFAHIGIEFCAGLARYGDKLIASFGVNDASAHLAFFDPDAVDRLLHTL